MPDPVAPDDTLRHEPAARARLRALRWLAPITRLWRPAPEAPVATSVPSRMHGVALAAYRVARPVVRPAAWRSRSFMTGHVMAELLDLRTKLDLLLERTEQGLHRPLDPGVGSAAERALLTLALESRRGPPSESG